MAVRADEGEPPVLSRILLVISGGSWRVVQKCFLFWGHGPPHDGVHWCKGVRLVQRCLHTVPDAIAEVDNETYRECGNIKYEKRHTQIYWVYICVYIYIPKMFL